MQHIRIENKVLIIHPHYLKLPSGNLYPVAMLAFQVCYDFLMEFRAKPTLKKQLDLFEKAVTQLLAGLSLIYNKDFFFS